MPKRPLIIATLVALLVVLAGAGVALRDASRNDTVDRDLSSPATTIAGFEGGTVGVPGPMPPVGNDFDEEAAKRSAVSNDAVAASGGGSAASSTGGGSAAPGPIAPDHGSIAPDQGSGFAPVPNQQQVIKTADLRLELARGGFRAAFDKASAAATGAGGFVVSSSTERIGDRVAAGTLVLRVPADRFDGVRASLAGLGKVEEEHQGGNDVSGQLVDLDARLRSLRAQEDVLVTLMGKARTVGETIEVQQQLSNVRMQIEQLAGEQGRLKDAVALSTITLFMAEKGVASTKPEEPREGIAAAFERAIDGAVAVVAGTIVVLGYLIPLSVLALIVWFAARLAWRRLKPATEPEPATS